MDCPRISGSPAPRLMGQGIFTALWMERAGNVRPGKKSRVRGTRSPLKYDAHPLPHHLWGKGWVIQFVKIVFLTSSER